MNNSATEREIERLSALYPKGFDLSLHRIERLLARLGNPHCHMPPVLHIAGTNGKGSAAAFLRALFESSNRHVHVHTSPHLVSWNERFRIDGHFVDDALLAETIARVAAVNSGEMITIFEILTAVMFLLFSENPADAAILEVGLGGRFDATNVVKDPAVSILMPISLDHQSFLGDRVELIAGEKAGIIKPACPVVISAQESDEARSVMVSTAERLGCPLWVYGEDFISYEEGGRFIYQDKSGLMDLSLPRLAGRHQIANAAAAITAFRAAGFSIGQTQIDQAMRSVQWPGRMQQLTKGHLCTLAPSGSEIWIDGGHNPEAGSVVAESLAMLEERSQRPMYLICGMINTKEPLDFFRSFAGMTRHVLTVPIGSSSAGIPPGELAQKAIEAGLSAEAASSIPDALTRLLHRLDSLDIPPRILVAGSLYLVGEALAINGTPPR